MKATSTDPDQNASILGDMVMYIIFAVLGFIVLMLLIIIKKMFSSLKVKIEAKIDAFR